jgi:cystathionine gamma-lyase
LEQHQGVTKTLYPGLPSHPQHDLAKRQQHGFGAMITFYCVGGKKQAEILLKNVSCSNKRGISFCPAFKHCCPNLILSQLKVFALAESLGAVESLAESPSLMTHASVPDDQKAKLKIDDTLIRLSVGIESCQDLIADLDVALNAAIASV